MLPAGDIKIENQDLRSRVSGRQKEREGDIIKSRQRLAAHPAHESTGPQRTNRG